MVFFAPAAPSDNDAFSVMTGSMAGGTRATKSTATRNQSKSWRSSRRGKSATSVTSSAALRKSNKKSKSLRGASPSTERSPLLLPPDDVEAGANNAAGIAGIGGGPYATDFASTNTPTTTGSSILGLDTPSDRSFASSKSPLKWEIPHEVSEFDWSRVSQSTSAIKQNVVSGLPSTDTWIAGARGHFYVIFTVVLTGGIIVGGWTAMGETFVQTALGPVLLVIGVLLVFFTATRLGAACSPWPVPNDQTRLYTTGFYAWMRHPMYAGLLAACFGYSVWMQSLERLLLSIILYIVLDQKARLEEKTMIETFGQEYKEYMEHVPTMFFPQFLTRQGWANINADNEEAANEHSGNNSTTSDTSRILRNYYDSTTSGDAGNVAATNLNAAFDSAARPGLTRP